MRIAHFSALVGFLAGCTSGTIDAGTRDAGGAPPVEDAAPEGPDGGPAVIASSVQPLVTQLVSDGTSLFWSTFSLEGPISSMPVGGGAIRTLGPANIYTSILSVDETSLYYSVSGDGLYRIPKDGNGPPTRVNDDASDAGYSYGGAGVLGHDLYWVINGPDPAADDRTTVKRAPSDGGPASTIAAFSFNGYSLGGLGVTSTALFFCFGTEFTAPLVWLPLVPGGVADAGPTLADAQCLSSFLSDTDAVYFDSDLPSVVRLASDGTITVLGDEYVGSGARSTKLVDYATIASDEEYIYWNDAVQIGTIMKAPKTGGTPIVIARDAYPIAIAVDDGAIYWSDLAGNVLRLAK